jgi:hypothetical protein
MTTLEKVRPSWLASITFSDILKVGAMLLLIGMAWQSIDARLTVLEHTTPAFERRETLELRLQNIIDRMDDQAKRLESIERKIDRQDRRP